MAEISRKDNKHIINTVVKIRDMERSCSRKKDTDKIVALTKAISDMEKIDKIEKIVYTYNFSFDVNPKKTIDLMYEIEKILRGGE